MKYLKDKLSFFNRKQEKPITKDLISDIMVEFEDSGIKWSFVPDEYPEYKDSIIIYNNTNMDKSSGGLIKELHSEADKIRDRFRKFITTDIDIRFSKDPKLYHQFGIFILIDFKYISH